MLYRALEEWRAPPPSAPRAAGAGDCHPAGLHPGFWALRLAPVVEANLRWRSLLLGCLLTSAAFTLARGMLGAFTDQYPSFRTPHPVNLAAAVATNVSLVLGTVARWWPGGRRPSTSCARWR